MNRRLPAYRPGEAVDPAVSARIRRLRLLLISGLLFVHLPPTLVFPYPHPPSGVGGIVGAFRISSAVVFYSSLPLLSVISGYLAAGSVRSYGDMLWRKTRTLLIPFFCWNAPVVFAIAAIQAGAPGATDFGTRLIPVEPRVWANALFAAGAPPANAPLYFLRDLWLCFAVAPLVRRALRGRRGWMWLPGGLLLGLWGGGPTIWLRPGILFWFALGVWLASADRRFGSSRWVCVGLAAGFLAGVAGATALGFAGSRSHPGMRLALAGIRVCGLPVFWMAAGRLEGTRIGAWLERNSGFAFFLFATHSPLLLAVWYAARGLTGLDPTSAGYAGFVAVAIPGVWGISYAAWRILGRTLPGVRAILVGGRSTRGTSALAPQAGPGAGR